jgi:hypothetical protein
MKKLLVCVAVLLATAQESAAVPIGPGDLNQPGYTHDGAFNLIAVDLTHPVTLGMGIYSAIKFDYQFSDFPSYHLTGSITPILLTGGGTSFTPIAVGSAIPFGGNTSFVSAPFGGISTFTLTSSTTVYAGLYWNTVFDGLDDRMPVGFQNNVGNSFVIFGGGSGPGANPPIVGTPISGSGQGFFARTYNFAIEVNQLPTAPEPSSIVLAAGLGAGLLGWGLLRKKLV